MERRVMVAAAVGVLTYVLTLGLGAIVLVPFAFAAAVWLYREMFRHGQCVGPFATTLVLLAVQNVAAGVLGGSHAARSLHAAIALSAVLPAGILLAGWLAEPHAARRALRYKLRGEQLALAVVAIAYSILTVARWMTGPIAHGLAIPALRNGLTPAYGLLIVLLLPPVLRPSINAIGQWLARWGVAVAVFGFVEFGLLGDRFWAKIAHVDAVISVKRLSIAHVLPYRVPADFYTNFGHHYVRRLVSLYGDAVTTSYYLALALVVALLLWRKWSLWRIAMIGVLGAALALGAVKGGLGIVVVGVLAAVALGTQMRRVFPSGAAVVFVACSACVVFGYGARFIPFTSSIDLHVDGLSTAVHEVTRPVDINTLWGNGVGSGGSGAVYARRSVANTPATREVPGLDNGAGAVLVQTGALGLLLLLAQFAIMINLCVKRAVKSRGFFVAATALTALLCNFLLQEHALTLITSLPFWFLGAVAVCSSKDLDASEESARIDIGHLEHDMLDVAPMLPPTIATSVAEAPHRDLSHAGSQGATEEDEEIVLPQEPAMVQGVLNLVEEPSEEQLDDDPALLQLMIDDMARGWGAFQPDGEQVVHVDEQRRRLRRDGVRDIRRYATVASLQTSYPALSASRGSGRDSDVQLALDIVLDDAPIVGEASRQLRAEMSMVELELALLACRGEVGRVPDLVPIDDLDISRVGGPLGFDNEGRFLTPYAMTTYRRYAYVSEFVDIRDVDLLIVLGAETGEQVEVLKQLHPHLTVAVFDHAPALYAAERYLSKTRPRDTVSYRETRESGPRGLKRGRIHFFLPHDLADLPRSRTPLLWSTGFLDGMTPEGVDHYARYIAPVAEWLFVNERIDGDAVTHHDTRERAFATYSVVERRPAYTVVQTADTPRGGFEDVFWKRRRKA